MFLVTHKYQILVPKLIHDVIKFFDIYSYFGFAKINMI